MHFLALLMSLELDFEQRHVYLHARSSVILNLGTCTGFQPLTSCFCRIEALTQCLLSARGVTDLDLD